MGRHIDAYLAALYLSNASKAKSSGKDAKSANFHSFASEIITAAGLQLLIPGDQAMIPGLADTYGYPAFTGLVYARRNFKEVFAMPYQALDVTRDGAIVWLSLNRPQSLNALNALLTDELHDFVAALHHDHEARVVVMRGAGRAFCAGLDLKEQASGGVGELGTSIAGTFEMQRRMSSLVIAIRRAPQPFIAAVRGPASGGGFALALAADVRLASPSARFNAAFIRIGLTACDMGVSYFLPRVVGLSVASELMLTGRFINADRALATGLVSEVVAEDALDDAAGKLAQEMTETSPLGLRLTKECLAMSVDAGSLEQAIFMEDRNQTLCVGAGYIEEGARAFVEKRKPRFQ